MAPNTKWNDKWQRFSSTAQESTIKDWFDSLDYPSSILVLYFSATGNTRRIAEFIQKTNSADIKTIEPIVPYTESDLDYRDTNRQSL